MLEVDMSPLEHDEVMSVVEVAVFLKLEPKTIRQYAREKKIPARKLGNQWRFLKSSLVHWLSEDYSDYEQKPAGVVLTSENKLCRYSKETTSIGSILDSKIDEYENLLEL